MKRLEPIVKTITVPCDAATAFEVFIKDMNSWWPLHKYTVSAMTGKPAREIRVEPEIGGKITEVAHDNREYCWGEIVRYEPPGFLSFRFHIPQPTEVVTSRSLVEITFREINPEETAVELRQSDWEAFGDRAKMMQGGYGSGWEMIFSDCYRRAAENSGNS